MKCKFCNSDKILICKNILSNHVNLYYNLFECKSCNSFFFDYNQHSNVNIQEVYENLATKFKENYCIGNFKNKYWLSQIKKIKRLTTNFSSILDVGCRTGDFLMHCPDNIRREGIELAKVSSDVAIFRGLNIYNDYVENINFQHKYDVVTCYAVLEHLVEPLKFLNKISSIISDNGLLVILIPTYECLKRYLLDNFTKIRWHMYSPPEHLNFFSRKFLDNYLNNKGFELAERYYTTGGLLTPNTKILYFNKILGNITRLIDEYTILNKFPIFDHMYSYYKRIK